MPEPIPIPPVRRKASAAPVDHVPESGERVSNPECPVCGGVERHYSFLAGEQRFEACTGCGLISHRVEPDRPGFSDRGDGPTADDDALPEAMMDALEAYLGPGERRVEVLGPCAHAVAEEGARRGLEATAGSDVSGSGTSDAVVVLDLLEDAEDPLDLLLRLRERLADGAVLAVATRQLRKPAASGGPPLLDRRQRHSFGDVNLETLLWKAGYGDVWLTGSADVDPSTPARPRRRIALARRKELRSIPRLSVVVPIFNEAQTVATVLEELREKALADLEIEVILVESNSTDGSRQLVERYRDVPRFRVVLEDRPLGKGHAVRTGLRHATGDVILIQDADLEYDFRDYETLVRPILAGRTAFVLGTRHSGDWKIRKFGQGPLASLMNMAHWGLCSAMNGLYGQEMTDPFTMFKVFRSGCLAGLDLECNRFDFDIEIVCKLLRKGYRPVEIPVNYQSRSFAEGKKVRIFGDPLTWVRAMFRYHRAPVVKVPARDGSASGNPERPARS